MSDPVATAILAGLGGMFGWGFADFFAKKTIDKSNDLTTLFWAQLAGVFPVLLLFLINPVVPSIHIDDWFIMCLLGAVSGLSYLLLYRGFGKGEVSLLSPVFASFAAVVVIISAIFFNETIPNGQFLGIAIVFAGLILISSDPGEVRKIFRTRTSKIRGLPEVLIAMFVYSFWLVAFDQLLQGQPWVFFVLIIRIASAATLLLFSKATQRSLKVIERSLWKYLITIGFFDIAAYSSVAYGFSHTTHLSVVAVLSAAFSLPTIVLAHLFLKEKATRWQVFASSVIIIGIVLVSMV